MMNNTNRTPAPKVGDALTSNGKTFTVVKVYPFGTADVVDDAKGKYYRVTGGPWIKAK